MDAGQIQGESTQNESRKSMRPNDCMYLCFWLWRFRRNVSII